MPQMVLLDYGQTLISEQKFDGVRKCLQITAASLWQFLLYSRLLPEAIAAVIFRQFLKGTEAVLQYAVRNKYHLSAEQVQAKANEINRELGRFDRFFPGLVDLTVFSVHTYLEYCS